MADNVQKRHYAQSINIFAQRKVLDALQQLGKALPASVTAVSGSIVTVKFEVQGTFTLPKVTVPAVTWQYIRVPIQVGEKGIVIPADATIAGIDGLGGGTAGFGPVGNLSALVFLPVASKAWTASEDANALVLYGPDGVVLRDSNSACKVVLTPSGITVTLPGGGVMTVNGNVAITGNLALGGQITAVGGGTFAGHFETSGDVIAGVGGADQVGLQTHKHGGITTGGGQSGSPTPGT
jgi:hypothetical protein